MYHDDNKTVSKMIREWAIADDQLDVWHGAKSMLKSYFKDFVKRCSKNIFCMPEDGVVMDSAVRAFDEQDGMEAEEMEQQEAESNAVNDVAAVQAEMTDVVYSKMLKQKSEIVYALGHLDPIWQASGQHSKADYEAQKRKCGFCGGVPSGGPPGHNRNACKHMHDTRPSEVADRSKRACKQRGELSLFQIACQWASSVRRHFFRTAASKTSPEEKARLWGGIKGHVRGDHTICKEINPDCECAQDGYQLRHPKMVNDVQYAMFCAWVDGYATVDFWKKYRWDCDTSANESFHSLMLKYISKRIHVKDYAFRVACSILHWNELVRTRADRFMKSYTVNYRIRGSNRSTGRRFRKHYRDTEHWWRWSAIKIMFNSDLDLLPKVDRCQGILE